MNHLPASHLNEEQLTLAYYGNADKDARRHLDACEECRRGFEQIQTELNELPEYAAPARPPGWETDVWNRLVVQLPARTTPRNRFWWMLAPAVTALVAAAFFAGILMERRTERGLSQEARARVLLMTTGDHLDRSERILAELTNSEPGVTDFVEERARARRLLMENRLLRQNMAQGGHPYTVALLDELERVLLDIAHTPANPSPKELEAFQRRIESEGLLFRIRIAGANLRQKEQKL